MAWVAADGYGHRLFKQPEVFRAHLERPLHKGEIGVVRHHRLREGGELHALATKLDDLLDNLVHGAFAAVEHRADLHGGGFDDGHCSTLYWSIIES